jgi:hypothetical protein
VAIRYGMHSTMGIIYPHEDHGHHPYSFPLGFAVCSARFANICTVRCQVYLLLWYCFLSVLS